MPILAVVGKPIKVGARIAGKSVEKYTKATFYFYRLVADAEGNLTKKSLGAPVSATAEGAGLQKVFKADWTPEGPDKDAGERECIVRFTVGCADLRPFDSPDEILVYYDWVAVEAVHPAGDAVKNATFHLTVTPLAGTTGGAPLKIISRTGDDGKAKVIDLSPGCVMIEFQAPVKLVAWTKGTCDSGVERKVTLEDPRYVAQLDWPIPGAEPHLQYVNLGTSQGELTERQKFYARREDRLSGREAHGSNLRLRLKTDRALAGNKIHVKVTFDADNSKRNDPRPMLLGGEGSYPTFTKIYEIALDGQMVTADIELGYAGKDKIKIEIGATAALGDATLNVETRRRLYYRVGYPAGQEASYGDIPAAVLTKARAHLEPAGIELVKHDAVPYEGGIIVGPKFVESMEWSAEPPKVFLEYGQAGPILTKVATTGVIPPEKQPLFVIIIAQQLYMMNESVIMELTNPEQKWAAAGHEIYSTRFSDAPLFGDVTWKQGSGESAGKGKLTPADVVVGPDGAWAKVKLPEGVVPSVAAPLKLMPAVKIPKYTFQAGNTFARGTVQAIDVDPKRYNVDKHALAIAHEIGHFLKQAPNVAIPGLAEHTHDETYGSGATSDSEQHGGSGAHCSFGLSPKTAADYSVALAEEGKHGTCVMFGNVNGKKTDFSKVTGFCKKCLPFLRAMHVTAS